MHLVAAQMICLELAGEPTNIKNADLNRMYESNVNFDNQSEETKQVKRALNMLLDIFPEKIPELTRYNVITLYCIISELIRNYVIAEIKNGFHSWFVDFRSE